MVHSLDILTVSSLLSGTGLVCTILYNEYWMYIILCVLFGITRGIAIIYFSLLLIQIVGKSRSHHGFGVCMTIFGIAILMGMSSFGKITDVTYTVWGYNIGFIVLGSCEIIAGFIFIGIRVLYKNAE